MNDYLIINTNVGQRIFKKSLVASIEYSDEINELQITLMTTHQTEKYKFYLKDTNEYNRIIEQL